MFERMDMAILKLRLKNIELANSSLMRTNKKLKEENEKIKAKNKQQYLMLQSLAETIEELNGEQK